MGGGDVYWAAAAAGATVLMYTCCCVCVYERHSAERRLKMSINRYVLVELSVLCVWPCNSVIVYSQLLVGRRRYDTDWDSERASIFAGNAVWIISSHLVVAEQGVWH